MSLLVTGSIGIDTVTTPHGTSQECLGGSSIYFCMAASFFTPVRLLGVIGNDCPFDLNETFHGRNVDLAGLEIRKNSKTFRWKGTYQANMNVRTTDKLELNVLDEEPPILPAAYTDTTFVFLANTSPALQLRLLEQLKSPVFIAADTMNCWIEGHNADLKKLLNKIDCLVINDEEAILLSGEYNLIKAARKILEMGPNYLIIKKGESGSMTFNTYGGKFLLPAYPCEQVKDPTGAGDSFAGAMMGYIAAGSPNQKPDFSSIKTAIAYGTVAASCTVEDFSLSGLSSITTEDIENRLDEMRKLVQF